VEELQRLKIKFGGTQCPRVYPYFDHCLKHIRPNGGSLWAIGIPRIFAVGKGCARKFNFNFQVLGAEVGGVFGKPIVKIIKSRLAF